MVGSPIREGVRGRKSQGGEGKGKDTLVFQTDYCHCQRQLLKM